MDGSQKAKYIYKPFGGTAVSWDADNNIVPDAPSVDHLYNGYKEDQETGLYYLNARYYDPMVAQFLTVDPAESGLNHYGYTTNPVMFSDPTGMVTVPIPPEIIGGTIAGAAGTGAVNGVGSKETSSGSGSGSGYDSDPAPKPAPAVIQFYGWIDPDNYDSDTMTLIKINADDGKYLVSGKNKAEPENKPQEVKPEQSYSKTQVSNSGKQDEDNQKKEEKKPNIIVQIGQVTLGCSIIALTIGEDVVTGGAGVADDVITIGFGLYLIQQVVLAKEKPKEKKERSPNRIGRRIQNNTRKKAYEKAKKAGKGREPIHHPDGDHGPHYHPDVPMPKPGQQAPKMPNPHDHYFY